VLLALLVYIGLVIVSIIGFKKKNVFSLCALLFLTTISIGSNLFIEIGTLMAERIVFIPSIFFCLALVLGGKKLIEFIKARSAVSAKGIAIALLIPFVLPYAGLTFARNFDWKNNQSLPLADITYNPNSARVNAAVGSAYLMMATRENVQKSEKDSLAQKAFVHLKKSISIYPEYNDALLDLGFYYNLKNDFDSADIYWSQVRQRSPNQPKLKFYDEFLTTKYMNPGMNFTATNPDSAIYYLNKALLYAFRDNTKLLTIYFNLAGMYFGKKDYQKAHDALQKVLEIDPNYPNAKAGFDQTEQLLKKAN
jgi:tetratricopeptide (TPR) repeat protein